jgi:hypothetical protein
MDILEIINQTGTRIINSTNNGIRDLILIILIIFAIFIIWFIINYKKKNTR